MTRIYRERGKIFATPTPGHLVWRASGATSERCCIDLMAIGAGIVGADVAHYGARAGRRVTVLENGEVAPAVAPAPAKEPVGPRQDPGTALDLARLSLTLWRDLARNRPELSNTGTRAVSWSRPTPKRPMTSTRLHATCAMRVFVSTWFPIPPRLTPHIRSRRRLRIYGSTGAGPNPAAPVDVRRRRHCGRGGVGDPTHLDPGRVRGRRNHGSGRRGPRRDRRPYGGACGGRCASVRTLVDSQDGGRRFANGLARAFAVHDGWMTWLTDDTVVCR